VPRAPQDGDQARVRQGAPLDGDPVLRRRLTLRSTKLAKFQAKVLTDLGQNPVRRTSNGGEQRDIRPLQTTLAEVAPFFNFLFEEKDVR
jgi:hypothetical protein